MAKSQLHHLTYLKSDIPFDSGVGTLYTDRRFELNEYGQRAFQRFEGIDGTIVQRVYNGGKWSDWSTVGGMNTVRGTFNSASVITDFLNSNVQHLQF